MATAKTPDPIGGIHYRASVEKGRTKPGKPNHHYWRVWARAVRENVWSGWATTAEAKAKVASFDAAAKKAGKTPPRRRKRKKKIAVVGELAYTKQLRRKMTEAGYAPFTAFPDRSHEISSVCEAVICLWRVTSTMAKEYCLEELRKGERPVIIVKSGYTSALEQLAEVEAGTWTPPNLADLDLEMGGSDEDEPEPEPEPELTERERKRLACAESIRTVIKSGGLFGVVLCMRSPSQARDALCHVPHEFFRVTRSTTYDAFQHLVKHSKGTIEEAQDLVAEEDGMVTSFLWEHSEGENDAKVSTRHKFVSHGNLEGNQLSALAEALTHPKGTFTLTEDLPKVEEDEVETEAEVIELPPPTPEEPEPVVPEPEPEPVPEPEPEPEPEPAKPVAVVPPAPVEPTDPATIPQGLLAALTLVVECLDGAEGWDAIPADVLDRANLRIENGQLSLGLVHLRMFGASAKTPTACGDGTSTSRTSVDWPDVNCQSCQEHPTYQWLVQADQLRSGAEEAS